MHIEKFSSAPLASFGTSASSDLPCLSVLPSVPVSNEMLQASVMRGMQTPQRRSVEKLKKGKPFFPEGARCRIVPRARAPQLAAPAASQAATTGESGRRPLSERPPSRSLGQVLCTGRVSSHRTGLAAEGPPQVVLGPRGGRPSRALGGRRPLCPRGQWSAVCHRSLRALGGMGAPFG